ncbi:MAG: lipid-A-disaccharide synthase-related protein [Synechococcales cyanobacterium]
MGRILCLSNGHGEDHVGRQLALHLHRLGHTVMALPLVGAGHPYTQVGIPLLRTAPELTSGGFNLLSDLRQGLGQVLWQQWQALRQQRSHLDLIVAVGDVLVMAMAWASGRPYAFVGTAKSDYYWGDEQGEYSPLPIGIPWRQQRCDYFPWERWLMAHPRCRAVYPRDGWTSRRLQEHFGIPALDLGNPMVDDLSDALRLNLPHPALLLLPGSRPPEAYRNWQMMMTVVDHLPPTMTCMAALAPTVDPSQLSTSSRPVQLLTGQFAAAVHHADVVLAMAGTATEQCVALGKPVVTLPGDGPQFTRHFAQKQARLLGSPIHLTTVSQAPALINQLYGRWTRDPEWRARLKQVGVTRLGSPGAAERISTHLSSLLIPAPPLAHPTGSS